MREFSFSKVNSVAEAVASSRQAGSAFLGGGTTLVDLARLNVIAPTKLVDIKPLGERYAGVHYGDGGLKIGALATMAEVAAHPLVRRHYPFVAEALDLSASPQIRNMARIGGNLLQRTRCTYFRDTSWAKCNRRNPGSGCQAIDGVANGHAVLGGSDACIALYHGDLAQPLIALDAMVGITSSSGSRYVPLSELHLRPGETPQRETVLEPSDLITAIHLPRSKAAARSAYTKLRDRASYEFATASAAVALELDVTSVVRNVRIALGGVATIPWRSREAERALSGVRIDEIVAREGAELAFADAVPRGASTYKIELGKRALVDAILRAAAMVPADG